jgi:hypothetical protein
MSSPVSTRRPGALDHQGPPEIHRALIAPPDIAASRTGARNARIILPTSSKFVDASP